MSDLPTDEVIGYKIVEIKNGKVKALFHGTNRSKEIALDRWYGAEKKPVYDRGGGKKYLSGWHFLKTKEECETLLNNVFRVKKDRCIIKCRFRTNIRPKHDKVAIKKNISYYLADEIYINSSDFLV
jgi:hypothetical protein